jgi:hypothetical protein
MFGGKIVGIFGLIAQGAAVCFWTYEAGSSACLAFTDPERAKLASPVELGDTKYSAS